MRQSKVIDLLVWVPNVVINRNGGTWYYVETIDFLIKIWVPFGLPCDLCMYINHIFQPFEPHLHHLHLESERGV